MSIVNINLLAHDDHTVKDVLDGLDQPVTLLKIAHSDGEYIYEDDDIDFVDEKLLEKQIKSVRVRRCDYGYFVAVSV